jgi:hypothetical protein
MHLNIILLNFFKINFLKKIKNILKIFSQKTTKKQWSKGALLAPYSVVGPFNARSQGHVKT